MIKNDAQLTVKNFHIEVFKPCYSVFNDIRTFFKTTKWFDSTFRLSNLSSCSFSRCYNFGIQRSPNMEKDSICHKTLKWSFNIDLLRIHDLIFFSIIKVNFNKWLSVLFQTKQKKMVSKQCRKYKPLIKFCDFRNHSNGRRP